MSPTSVIWQRYDDALMPVVNESVYEIYGVHVPHIEREYKITDKLGKIQHCRAEFDQLMRKTVTALNSEITRHSRLKTFQHFLIYTVPKVIWHNYVLLHSLIK